MDRHGPKSPLTKNQILQEALGWPSPITQDPGIFLTKNPAFNQTDSPDGTDQSQKLFFLNLPGNFSDSSKARQGSFLTKNQVFCEKDSRRLRPRLPLAPIPSDTFGERE